MSDNIVTKTKVYEKPKSIYS